MGEKRTDLEILHSLRLGGRRSARGDVYRDRIFTMVVAAIILCWIIFLTFVIINRLAR